MRRRLGCSLALLAALGCVRPAIEQHSGLSPVPSRMPDAGFVAVGAAWDEGLSLAKVPLAPRLALDGLAAWAVRDVSTFGRTEGSGLFVLIGAWSVNLVRIVLRGSP